MDEKRIQALESILIDVSVYKRKSSYVYIIDLLKALEKQGLIREIPEHKVYRIVYKNQDYRKIKNKGETSEPV